MAISKSFSSTSTSPAGKKRLRVVRFNATVKHVSDTRRTSDCRNTWYDTTDMASFKESIRSDFRKAGAGQTEFKDSDEVSWRGLEVYTQKRSKYQRHRRERRAFLVTGVKDLQTRLRAVGLPVEGALHKFMTIACKQAVEVARTLAEQDTADANQIYLEQFLMPTTSGRNDKMSPTDVCAVANDGLLPTAQQLITARTA